MYGTVNIKYHKHHNTADCF